MPEGVRLNDWLGVADEARNSWRTKMELRKVIVSHMIGHQQEGTHRLRYALEPQGEATFHQFGVGYEEFEAGPGNFTTAIVEWPDGRVESVPVEHVRFVTPNS